MAGDPVRFWTGRRPGSSLHAMLRRLGIGLLWGVIAYVPSAILGAVLIYQTTSNRFDRDMEAGMTGAFAIGPLVALIAFVVGFVRSGRPRP